MEALPTGTWVDARVRVFWCGQPIPVEEAHGDLFAEVLALRQDLETSHR